MLARLDLEHTVITCVDRDDLRDFGAAHWAETIRRVKAACPEMTLEILAGDFKGKTELVDVVLDADPDVFAHNLETVPRLSRQVRVQASYPRSYKILEHARKRGAVTKTGLMLGLGETRRRGRARCSASSPALGVDIVTLGQYLAPSKQHLAIERYVHPTEFVELEAFARDAGITHVVAGPLVRSSYHADGQAALVRSLRRSQANVIAGRPLAGVVRERRARRAGRPGIDSQRRGGEARAVVAVLDAGRDRIRAARGARAGVVRCGSAGHLRAAIVDVRAAGIGRVIARLPVPGAQRDVIGAPALARRRHDARARRAAADPTEAGLLRRGRDADGGYAGVDDRRRQVCERARTSSRSAASGAASR